MGLRFRKSIRLAPGLRINISKSGFSTSVGGRGATINLSKKGARATVGIPGSGLSYSAYAPAPKERRAAKVDGHIESRSTSALDSGGNTKSEPSPNLAIMLPIRKPTIIGFTRDIFTRNTMRGRKSFVMSWLLSCLVFVVAAPALAVAAELTSSSVGLPSSSPFFYLLPLLATAVVSMLWMTAIQRLRHIGLPPVWSLLALIGLSAVILPIAPLCLAVLALVPGRPPIQRDSEVASGC